MSDVSHNSAKWEYNLLNTIFLLGTPVIALLGAIWYISNYSIGWEIPVIFLSMYLATGFSITAGYHRLFSHRTHNAAWPLRLFYALFAAGAFQNSAIKWCSDHRRHHLKTDEEEDPYSVKRGFFWAHMGWVMVEEGDDEVSGVEDLQDDPILVWQDRHIFKIGALMGVGFPGLLGLLMIGGWQGFLAGVIWGGFVRLVFVHHGTFLINSAAHCWGTQPYSTKNTSRDSPLLSIFTFGEGYHNFHHTFQADYRNGHKWHHWDPSKWWIKCFSFLGLTKKLHRVPQWTIESARMRTSFEKNITKNDSGDAESYHHRLKDCLKRLRFALRELSEERKEYRLGKRNTRAQRKEMWGSKKEAMKVKLRECKARIANIRKEFENLLKEMGSTPTTA